MTFEVAKQNIGKMIYCFHPTSPAQGKLVGVKPPNPLGWYDILIQYEWGGQMWEPGHLWGLYPYDDIFLGASDSSWTQDGF